MKQFLFISSFFCFSLLNSTVKAQATVTPMTVFNELNLTTVAMLPDGNVFSFSFGNTSTCTNMNVIKSTSFLDNWAYVNTCSTVSYPESYLSAMASHFFDANTGCVVMSQEHTGYGSPKIYKTTDGGITWTIGYTMPRNSGLDRIPDFAFKDDAEGLAILSDYNSGAFYSKVIKTTNGGDSWTLMPDVFNDINFKKISYVDGTYYILGIKDVSFDPIDWRIYKSTDAGVTWSLMCTQNTPITGYVSMQFISSFVGYIGLQEVAATGYNNSKVLKTVDGGITWIELGSTVSALSETMDFNDLHFINENEGFVIAGNHCDEFACYRGYAILHTLDGGVTWSAIAKQPYAAYALYDISYSDSVNIGYVSGGDIETSSGHLFKIQYSPVGVYENKSTNYNVEVYPNPSNGGIVNVFSKDKENLHLRIYTLDGKNILQKTIQAGKTELQLTSGVYLCEVTLENGEKIQTKRIIVL